MGNRFGISGLGSEPVRRRRDVDDRASESYRPPEEFGKVLGAYSTVISSLSQSELAVKKEVNENPNTSPVGSVNCHNMMDDVLRYALYYAFRRRVSANIETTKQKHNTNY